MKTIQLMQWLPRRPQLCLLMLLLILASADNLPAAEQNSGSPHQPSNQESDQQTDQESQPPERLAPLGLEKLMDIPVTTVTRMESTIGESAAAVTVITQEDIRRSGATTIAELFRRVPGMDVARIDNNKWAISARGFNERFSNKLLVQRDGRTIYDPIFAGVVWNAVQYPLEDIERIEVIRGPGASVWGANAVNGVINVITKSASDTQGRRFKGVVGTPEGEFGELRYGGSVGDKAHYRIYANGFDREKQSSPQGDPNDQWRGGSTGMRLDWQSDDGNSFTIQGDYVHSDAGRRDPRPRLSPPSSTLIPDKFVSDNTNLLARWIHRTGEQSNWRLQAYWWRFDSEQPAAGLKNSYDTYDLDFQHQFPIGARHKFIYGLEYRFHKGTTGNSNDNGFSVTWVPNEREFSLYSTFVQDEVTLRPGSLSVIVGSKFEHNDFTGFEIQPSARLLWTPSRGETIWGAISRAVRTPSILEQSIQVTNPPSILPSGAALFSRAVGNLDLQSEKLIAYELGYRAQPSARLSLDGALFYNDYNNLVISVPQRPQAGPVPGTLVLPVLFDNRMNGTTYGIELAATASITPDWRLYAAYSYLKMNLDADPSLPASTRASIESTTAGRNRKHQLYVQSSWNIGPQVKFDLIGRYVSALSGFVQEIPAYVAVDARLAYQPRKDVEISLVGQNLFDKRHPEFGAASFLSTPTVEIRRNVFGQIVWRF